MPPPLLSAFGDLGDFGDFGDLGDGFFDDEEEVDEPDEPDEPDEGVFERCLGGAVIASTLLDAIALAAAAARLAGSSCRKNLGPLCPVTLLRR